MQETDRLILKKNVLFQGMKEPLFQQITEKYGQVRTVPKETPLLSADAAECAVLLSGTGRILSTSDVKPMTLRFATAGDTLGLAGLFLPSPIPTTIVSCGEKPLRAYILTLPEVRHIMNRDRSGNFRDTVLQVLSKKAAFLNSRIACVTSGNAETRFALFLLSSLGNDGTLDPDMSMTALADTLNMGRASLYRAVTDLSSRQLITYENNIFTVPDQKKLEQFCFGKKEA